MSETETLLRSMLTRFLAEHYGAAARRAIVEGDKGWSQEIWSQLAELGLLAAPIDAAYGGLGAQGDELVVIMESLGRALVVEPYVSTVVIGARLFGELGDEAALTAIGEGRMRLALAQDDAPAMDPREARPVTVRPVEDGLHLSGSKVVVRDAPSATHLIVTAQSSGPDPEPMLLIAPAATPGVTLSPYRLIDGARGADIAFDVVVPRSALLASGPRAQALVMALVDAATVAICAEAGGVMRAMLEQTVAYTRQRRQFGHPLSNFQVLQHRMVDMLIEIEQTHSLTRRAALSPDDNLAVAYAKIRADRALRKVAHDAVQLHGGIGTTAELELSQYFRRATAIQRQFGASPRHYKRVEHALAESFAATPAPGAAREPDAGRRSVATS